MNIKKIVLVLACASIMPILGMKKARHDRSELTRARDGAEELLPANVFEKLIREAQEGIASEMVDGGSAYKELGHKNRLVQKVQGNSACPVCTQMITPACIEKGTIELTGWCCSTLICAACKWALILEQKPCPKCNWPMY